MELPVKAGSSLFGRNRLHGAALTSGREHEAFVAVLRDLGALPAIPADALRTQIGQEAPRLAGDVSSHVPGIGDGHQGRVHDLGDMGAPRVLRLRRRLDRCKLVSSHVGDAFGDPLDVLLDRYRHVRQHRRALRAGDGEQVRVAGDSQAQIGLRAVLPLLRQCPAATSLDAKFLQRAGQRIETGSDNDDIERVVPAARANAGRRDLLDWAVGGRIHQLDVFLLKVSK
jgi:hypothetical protein